MRWQETDLVSIDTETTGPDPSTARLLEFAAIRFSRGRRPFGWSTLVGGAEVGASTAIHGITQAEIDAAPLLRDRDAGPDSPTLAEQIAKELLEAGAIIGYNVLRYDLPVLLRELAPHLEASRLDRIRAVPVIDVLVWIWSIDRYVAGSGRHRLSVAAERWGVEVPRDLHRAAADAMLTIRLLAKIRDRLPEDLGDLIAEQTRLAAEREDDFASYLAKKRK